VDLRRAFRRASCLLASALALGGCASLPPPPQLGPSSAVTATGQTRLGRSVALEAAAHPGLSGAQPLADGREAFAARYLLAHAAERSLDLQYYIWHDDTSGGLLAQAVWQAAERGVRVRLLLDDANTGGLDRMLGALDAHPNIEVRLFNPFASRSWRIASAVGDLARVNRRMHNKSFTADNQFSVVGGRNIGDEYMGAEVAVEFTDLDVLAAGAVVPEISHGFDAYWNSPSSYPLTSLQAPMGQDDTVQVRAGWDSLRASPLAVRYLSAVREMQLVRNAIAGTLQLDWVPARVVQDDPAKVLRPPEEHATHMLPHLEEALGKPLRELILVSPYFVPGKEGTQSLVELASRGVKVVVLTNSLAATDVGMVYAGYARYRSALLRGGVKLYELKRGAQVPGEDGKLREHKGLGGSSGSSGASLHAKTFAVDRARVFVGSFNLDPRSIRLNTEMGVVLDSPKLAGRLAQVVDEDVPANAYELRLDANGAITWLERTGAGDVVHTRTPETGVLRLLGIGAMSLLPIEWLL